MGNQPSVSRHNSSIHIIRPDSQVIFLALYLLQDAIGNTIPYAYVGRVVAEGKACRFHGNSLDLLVDSTAFANNAEKLAEVLSRFPELFKFISEQLVIIIENRGVLVRLFRTGSDGYPANLICRDENPNRDYTVVKVPLGQWADSIKVPVLRSSLLLQHRLLRAKYERGDESASLLDEVKELIQFTIEDGDFPFPPDVARELAPTVNHLIANETANIGQSQMGPIRAEDLAKLGLCVSKNWNLVNLASQVVARAWEVVHSISAAILPPPVDVGHSEDREVVAPLIF